MSVPDEGVYTNLDIYMFLNTPDIHFHAQSTLHLLKQRFFV